MNISSTIIKCVKLLFVNALAVVNLNVWRAKSSKLNGGLDKDVHWHYTSSSLLERYSHMLSRKHSTWRLTGISLPGGGNNIVFHNTRIILRLWLGARSQTWTN